MQNQQSGALRRPWEKPAIVRINAASAEQRNSQRPAGDLYISFAAS
jgi:hypothetical protein